MLYTINTYKSFRTEFRVLEIFKDFLKMLNISLKFVQDSVDYGMDKKTKKYNKNRNYYLLLWKTTGAKIFIVIIFNNELVSEVEIEF